MEANGTSADTFTAERARCSHGLSPTARMAAHGYRNLARIIELVSEEE
jgi:hypothetical protein